MQDTLEFPIITDPAPGAIVPLSIKATVLAQFTATETDLRALAAKYANVAFDVSTPKGLAEAKAARLDLRENGRYLVERAEKRIKGEVNDLKSSMAAEVERLVAIVRPAEDAVDSQIKAREEAIAAEKAEAERKAAEAAMAEANRKQRHEDGIATLAGYIGMASGKTAEQIAGGIDFVRGITIDPAHWQEYAERAQSQLDATLTALDGLHAAAVKAEAEAAELAALRAEKAARDERERQQRAEAERQAAAETQRLAAEEAARQTLLQDQSRALTDALASKPDAMLHAREAAAAIVAADTYLPASGPAVVVADIGSLETSEADAIIPSPAAPEPATLNLSAINARFDGRLAVTAAGLALLGIDPAATDKSAKLYRESDFGRICAALQAHIARVAELGEVVA